MMSGTDTQGQATPVYHQLVPRGGPIFAVRWVRRDGRDVKHRYFRREHDAQAFAARLRSFGRAPHIYVSPTHWREVVA